MELIPLDDYQTWLLRLDTTDGRHLHVLVDPWLTERYAAGGPWLLGRRHRAWVDVAALPKLDAILLSAHFPDHLDLATLRQIDPSVPIVTTKAGARRLRRLGRERIEALAPEHRHELGPGVTLQTVRPGFPYLYSALGFLIHEQLSDRRIYVEAHMTDEARVAALRAEHGSVDVMVAPVESVRLLGLPVAMAGARALRAVELLGPRFFVPTGLDPRQNSGLLARLLRCRGSVAEFAASLAGSPAHTELLALEPGQGFVVPGSRASTGPTTLPLVHALP